jgi:hypothetical protein
MAEAGYYQALAERLPLDDREQPERALARLLHKTATHIRARLDILGLEPEVQAMVDRKVLPQSAAPHLLRLSGASQVEVARAAQGRPVRDVARLVDSRLLRDRGLGQLSQERRPDPPVEELPVSQNGGSGDGVPLEALTLAVRATCGACQLAGASGGLSEILWLDVHKALAQSCRACNVSNMREACLACPVVDFLQHLATLLRESGGVRREAVPEHLYEKRVLVR